MLTEGAEVEVFADDNGGHSDAAFRARDRHPVNDRVDHAGTGSDRLGHLGGRHILSLPPEGVADPVDEVEVALLVLSHQVARAEPGVAKLEHVAEDLFLGGFPASVTLESTAEARRVLRNLADGLADLVGRTANAQALVIPERRLVVEVESDDV